MKVNNIPKTYIYKANTGEAYEYVDPFDYKGKEKKDLVPGDDISIGTENFRVFYNQDGVIKAMPFYNLKLDSSPMRQATYEEANDGQEGTSTFSEEAYWLSGKDEIDMLDSRNNIQKYIGYYSESLTKLGLENIGVRIAKYSELSANGVTNSMRNPGQINTFWIGSSCDTNNVRFINIMYGTMSYFSYNNNVGVRPIIVIEY